ncbi:MAG: hypothetical protein RR767_12795 [Acinetobacter sp.]
MQNDSNVEITLAEISKCLTSDISDFQIVKATLILSSTSLVGAVYFLSEAIK